MNSLTIQQRVGDVVALLISTLATLLVVASVILAPHFNELWVGSALEPAFEQFESITSANYPDVEDRLKWRSRVLEERHAMTAAATWPLMTCRSAFIMHNPGTVYRKDEKQVVCSWMWFADD